MLFDGLKEENLFDLEFPFNLGTSVSQLSHDTEKLYLFTSDFDNNEYLSFESLLPPQRNLYNESQENMNNLVMQNKKGLQRILMSSLIARIAALLKLLFGEK